MNSIESSYLQFKDKIDKLKDEQRVLTNSVYQAQLKLESLKDEQEIIKQSQEVMKLAKALLSQSSIDQCIKLANTAVQTIFQLPYTVEFDNESASFMLNKGSYSTVLSEDEGGGIVTVVSFVLDVYLLIKLGKRRFMMFDEAFTQVSSAYFDRFMSFVKTICHEFQVDILLISHDQRLTFDLADNVYEISNGASTKIK